MCKGSNNRQILKEKSTARPAPLASVPAFMPDVNTLRRMHDYLPCAQEILFGFNYKIVKFLLYSYESVKC